MLLFPPDTKATFLSNSLKSEDCAQGITFVLDFSAGKTWSGGVYWTTWRESFWLWMKSLMEGKRDEFYEVIKSENWL